MAPDLMKNQPQVKEKNIYLMLGATKKLGLKKSSKLDYSGHNSAA